MVLDDATATTTTDRLAGLDGKCRNAQIEEQQRVEEAAILAEL